MKFEQIVVVKETHNHEKRVALTPSIVKKLTTKGYNIHVEIDAGLGAGFSNEAYERAGAKLFSLELSGLLPNSFIVRVLRPSKERELCENRLFKTNTAMLGFLFPFVKDTHIATWQSLNLTTLSFDLFSSLSIQDLKNAQAAMSRIAGRLALSDALKHYEGQYSPRVSIIGAGAAGQSAAFEAIKYQFPVQVFARNNNLRAQFEEKGGTFYVVPPNLENQIRFLQNHLHTENIIITTARQPGDKAPLLITKEVLNVLPEHTVIVDLAVSNGGNVVGSKHDCVVKLPNQKKIVNVSGYPKNEPKTASEAYANCVMNVLLEILTPAGVLNFDNSCVQELWVTHAGRNRYADT